MNLACLKESLVHYATISYSDKHDKPNLYTKEVAKQVLRNAIVITKNCSNKLSSYQRNIGT